MRSLPVSVSTVDTSPVIEVGKISYPASTSTVSVTVVPDPTIGISSRHFNQRCSTNTAIVANDHNVNTNISSQNDSLVSDQEDNLNDTNSNETLVASDDHDYNHESYNHDSSFTVQSDNVLGVKYSGPTTASTNNARDEAFSIPDEILSEEEPYHGRLADQDNKGEDDESDYDYEEDGYGNYASFLISESPMVTSSSSPSAITVTHDPVIEKSSTNLSLVAGGGELGMKRSISLQVMDDFDNKVATSTIKSSTSLEITRQREKWREPSRSAVHMSLRAEREKTGGRRRLAQDLYKVMMADTTEAGFSIEPAGGVDRGDGMDRWIVNIFGFDEDSNLHKDLLVLGLDHVELEMSFPEQYPFEPPFVRVVQPRFKKQTGFVMNGALCMELLTSEGWNPVNDIESVIVSIRSLLAVGDGRLQAAVDIPDKTREALLCVAKRAVTSGKQKMISKDDDENHSDNIDNREDDTHVTHKRKRDKYIRTANSSLLSSSWPLVTDNDNEKKCNDVQHTSNISVGSYTNTEARQAYSHLSEYHKKKGWDSSGWWTKKG